MTAVVSIQGCLHIWSFDGVSPSYGFLNVLSIDQTPSSRDGDIAPTQPSLRVLAQSEVRHPSQTEQLPGRHADELHGRCPRDSGHPPPLPRTGPVTSPHHQPPSGLIKGDHLAIHLTLYEVLGVILHSEMETEK